MPRVDRWLGTCLTLVALVWLWLVHTDIPDIRTEVEPGPRGFPQLLGVALVLLGVILLARSFRSVRLKPPFDGAQGAPEAFEGPDTTYDRSDDGGAIAPVTRREVGFASGVFALLVFYAFLLERVGFLVGTPLVMVLAMAGLLRMRTWLSIALLAFGFTFGCWLIFDALLGTPLPRGTWMTSL